MIKYQCRLLSINPYVQTEADGDEIFLKINKKRVWPFDQKFYRVDLAPITVNLILPLPDLKHRVEIDLWEYDNFIFKSKIGQFVLSTDQVGGPYTTDLTGNKKSHAKYSLVWELTKQLVPDNDRKISKPGKTLQPA